ncbi:MAG TPA: hypothetical protein PL105_04060 [Caldilineaceae bacterium]|nr:hypothetical protein [Caldilineaceae bacterium]
MPASTNSLSRTLTPADQRAIAAQLHAQRQHEDALRIQARAWPAHARRHLARFINTNRTARLEIWHILNPAEETLWPTA